MKIELKNWWAVIEDPEMRPDIVLVSEKKPRPIMDEHGNAVIHYADPKDKGDWYYVGIGLIAGGIPYEETGVDPEFTKKFLTPKKITITIEIEETN